MSSLFHDAKRQTYRQVRAVSQGASISLFHGCHEYVATFNCATAIAAALGDRNLTLEDGIPHYRIPLEQMFSELAKLSERYSVALVFTVCGEKGMSFVLLWKVPVSGTAKTLDEKQPDLNLDEY